MPTAGSVLITKSCWPIPRINTVGELVKPLVLDDCSIFTFGVAEAISLIFKCPLRSISSSLKADTAIGVSCKDSSLLLAVTTISSIAKAPEAVL